MSAPGSRQPVAGERPCSVLSPHGARVDPWYWLRDDPRTDPDVLAYLAAENAWKDAWLAPHAALAACLRAEMAARIAPDESSVPYRMRGYWYQSRYEPGAEQPRYMRWRDSPGASEELLLDSEQRAAGSAYYRIEALAVSPDNRYLAWAEDRNGRRQCTLRMLDLATGLELADRIENVEDELVWAADSRTLLYIEKDPVTLLGCRVRAHALGSASTDDRLVYELDDPAYYLSLGRTKDDRYLLIELAATDTTESRYASAADPALRFEVFLPREAGHQYEVDHLGSRWVIRTNWGARDYRIVTVDDGREGDRTVWRELVAHPPQGHIHGFDVYERWLAVEERAHGLRRIRIVDWDGSHERLITGSEAAYTCALDRNEELACDVVRYTHDTLITARRTLEFEPATGIHRLLKQDAVPGGYDPAAYRTERLMVTARDGAVVPVSLAWHRDTSRDGTAPLLQYAYGAYGLARDPEFSRALPSLLDRGFVYALAHVRGGLELGRDWYEQGRRHAKANTIHDFIDVTLALVARGLVDPRRLFARGGSAGGLLMGAVAQRAATLYRGIIALVPFLDVVTTMLDEDLPLTTNEYDEWGDPRLAQDYAAMLAWSPYDALAPGAYPAMYLATGLWDSQVQYFEPAKYVARLRALRTDANTLLLRTDLAAGHGGAPGRYAHLEEVAEQWTFLLVEAGLSTTPAVPGGTRGLAQGSTT